MMCRPVQSPPKSLVMVIMLWLGSNMITTMDAFSPPVPTTNPKRSTTATTTTSIMMFNFDWFNPKPTAEKKVEEAAEDAKAKEEEDNKEKQSAEFIEKGLETSEPPKSGDEIISEIEKESSDVVVEKTTNKKAAEPPQQQQQHEIHSGTVAWFDRTKGFGFIRPNEGSEIDKDIFVHQSEIQVSGWRYLMQGEPVEYGVVEDTKGFRALHVTGPNGGKLLIEQRRGEKGKDKKEEASEKK